MDEETASTSESGSSSSTTDDSSSGGDTGDSSGSSDTATTDPTTGGTGGSDSSTSEATTIDTSDSSGTTDNTTDATTDTTDTDTDTDTDTTGDPPDGCDGEPIPIDGLVTSMAYLQSQIPPNNTTGNSTSGSSGGDEPHPGTLHISLSNQSIACEDPNSGLDCGENWEVSIVIPPEFQSPGLYAVGTDINGVFGIATETGPDEGGNMCAFGGGSWEATLEIIAIDDTLVEGRLCNVDEYWSWTKPDLNGVFYAERCPG